MRGSAQLGTTVGGNADSSCTHESRAAYTTSAIAAARAAVSPQMRVKRSVEAQRDVRRLASGVYSACAHRPTSASASVATLKVRFTAK